MDVHQIVFTNLTILGLDPFAMERKWRIPFNKEMFNLPNKKGFEAVMYFIFEKYNATKCREQFRDCWPVTDKKEEQEFRKVVNSWLSELSKEPDAHFPRIVPSLFLSPGGEKLYFLLLVLTRFVMHKLITQDYGYKQREFLRPPVLTSQNQNLSGMIQMALQRQAIQYRKQYLALVQEVVAVEEEWKQFAKGEVQEYRTLSSQIRELERQVKSELHKSLELGTASPSSVKNRSKMTEYDNSVESIKRAQRVQKVRDHWKILDDLNRNKAGEREVVESILEGTLDGYRIHGSQLNVKVPEILLRECEKEIQRRGVENIYEGGKLNLISLLHLWNLSLHLYIEKIHQAGLPDLEEANPTLTTQQQTSHAYLTNMQSLRLKLEETIRTLKESVEVRKKELDELVLSSRSPKSVRSTSYVDFLSRLNRKLSKSLGFGLMPPTPPVSFEPSKGRTPSSMDFRVSTSDQDAQGSTPEAAVLLMNSIHKRVVSQSGSPLVQGSPVYAPRMDVSTKQSSRLPVLQCLRPLNAVIAELEAREHSHLTQAVFKALPNAKPNSTQKRANSIPAGFAQLNSPLGEGSEVVKKGSKQLTKKKTALGKQQQHQLHRGQGQCTSNKKSGGGGNVKATPSGTQLIKHSKVKGKKAKQELTEQVTVSSTVNYQKGRYQPQRTSTPPLGGAVSGEVHLDTSVLSSIPRSPPPEEDALVDRLVDELLTDDSSTEVLGQNHSPPDENLLVKNPFTSKDKLHRTPEKSNWQELLENSYGPLSSTRLDGSSKQVERGDRDKVVTRLVLSPKQIADEQRTPQTTPHSSSRQETYGAERDSIDYSPHTPQGSTAPQQPLTQSTKKPTENPQKHTTPYRSKALEEDPYGENSLKFNTFTPNLSGVGVLSDGSSLNWADIQQKLSFGTEVSESYRHLSESATPTLPSRSRGRDREVDKVSKLQNSSSSGSSGALKSGQKKTEQPLITFDTPPEIDPTPSHLSSDVPAKVFDVLTMTPKKEGTEYNLGIFDLNLIERLEKLSGGRQKDPSPSTDQRLSEGLCHSVNTTLTEGGHNTASDNEDTIQNHVKWKDLEQEIRNADKKLHESQLTSLTSDLEDDTVKVIHFEDGSFNEFQDKSSVKHPSRKPSKYNPSQQSDTDNSERTSPSPTRTADTHKDREQEDCSIKRTSQEGIHTSNAASDWNSQPAQTDSLIARYKRIRSAQGSNELSPHTLDTLGGDIVLSQIVPRVPTVKVPRSNDRCDEARLESQHPFSYPSPHSSQTLGDGFMLKQSVDDDLKDHPQTDVGLKPFSPTTENLLSVQNNSIGQSRRKFTLDFDESFENYVGGSNNIDEDERSESAVSGIDDILMTDPLAKAAQRPLNMWSPKGTAQVVSRQSNRGSTIDPFGPDEVGILQLTPMLHNSPHPTSVQQPSKTTDRPEKLVSLPSFPDIFGEDESLLVPASPP